jgi:cell division septal protein FtsQ
LARKFRKQKVALRFKRREQLKHRLRAVGVRGIVLALIVGFGAGLVTGGDSYAFRFMCRHTPQIELAMPPPLARLPVLAELPKNPFWLWSPGSGFWLQRRVCRLHPEVRNVQLERYFDANRLTVRVEPRVPLVVWNGSGFDQEGALFAIAPGAWKALPEADFLATAGKRDLGRWLARLAAMNALWPQVASIRQSPSGDMELSLLSGAVILWGPPDLDPSSAKAQALTRVLDDAHQHLGGAASADLRFFEQGRIIVRPKGR